MGEVNQLPYLPFDVLTIIANYATKQNIDDRNQFKLVSREFYNATSNDLSYRMMNLEYYSTLWLPTDT